jgi:hypothetical protein
MATWLGQVGARGAAAAGDAEPVAVRAAVEAGASCVCCAAAAWAVGLLLIGYSVFMSRKHKFSDLI